MRKRYAAFAVLFFVVSLFAIGCKGKSSTGSNETVVFQNRSGMNGVNCYIDFVYRGTINNNQNLTVEGDFEGDRVLSADGPALWGPEVHYVANGGGFVWTLTR